MTTITNIYGQASKGMKTKFDASQVRFKKTFAQAKKAGIDLNNTMNFFKKDGMIWKVSFVSGRYTRANKGRYFERVTLLPWVKLN